MVVEEEGETLVDDLVRAEDMELVEERECGEGDEAVETVDEELEAEEDGEGLVRVPEDVGVPQGEDKDGEGVVEKLNSEDPRSSVH